MNVKKDAMLYIFEVANHSIKIRVLYGFQLTNQLEFNVVCSSIPKFLTVFIVKALTYRHGLVH